ncbi:MAG: hypothetical protein ABIG63_14515 [Chloroflexota bacterium]
MRTTQGQHHAAVFEEAVPGGAQMRGQRGIRMDCIGEFIHDENDGLRTDDLRGHLENFFPQREARGDIPIPMLPIPDHARQTLPREFGGISPGDPVEHGQPTLGGKMQEQRGFSNPAAPMQHDELRRVLVVQFVQNRKFLFPIHKNRHHFSAI